MGREEQVLNILKKEGFDATIEPSNDTSSVDQILLYLGDKLTLHILVTEQILKEKGYFKIDFFAPFSCRATSKTIYDLSSLLHFLNLHQDLPGFILNEGEMLPFYKTTQFFYDLPDPLLLKSIIGHLSMTFESYSDLVHDVATGKKTFNAIIEEVLELIK